MKNKRISKALLARLLVAMDLDDVSLQNKTDLESDIEDALLEKFGGLFTVEKVLDEITLRPSMLVFDEISALLKRRGLNPEINIKESKITL